MTQPTPWWEAVIAADLQRLRDSSLLRTRRIVRPIDVTTVECDGRHLINFSSNNYLGLTHHPNVRAAVEETVACDGFGSGAAPLISGYTPTHASAEQTIARWKGTQASVLLPSGYQANLAAIQTIAAIGRLSGGVRFLADKLVHASLIDAIRATGEELRIFPHNHIAKLRRLLGEGGQQVVVTESIFSMDGDAADLKSIAGLKKEHEFLLMVDEAHAAGVYGPNGAGLVAELGLRDSVDVTVVTLSKALGGIGGAICATATFCQALINHARAYLFSTNIPAAVAAAGEAAIRVLHEEPQHQLRLRQLARYVREQLGKTHQIPPGDSPIIPIILGDEENALRAAEKLSDAGMLVVAVRPPTVARGSSRLRITLCSEHTDQQIGRLIETVSKM